MPKATDETPAPHTMAHDVPTASGGVVGTAAGEENSATPGAKTASGTKAVTGKKAPLKKATSAPSGAETTATMTRRDVAATSASRTPAEAPPTTAPSAAKGATTMAKPAETKTAARKVAPVKATRSAAETEKIRAALAGRRDELRAEYDQTLSEINELQRDRLTDSAGDDQADTGTKTFEREQEISLANSILERITQVERALERLDDGQYGWCERCGNPIPVERLAAFPSATLCVTCKQLEERR